MKRSKKEESSKIDHIAQKVLNLFQKASSRNCRICGGKAWVYLPQYNLALCKRDFETWFLRQLERTIKRFNMFSKNDRILVGVSGGKDSLSLFHALASLGYNVSGLFIDLGIDKENFSKNSFLKSQTLSDDLGKELLVVHIDKDLGFTIPDLKRFTYKEYCSVCGLVKRYFLNQKALEYGFDVLVTGHHLMDEATTLFSNLLQWQKGYLGRQSPVLPAYPGFVKKAKPFVRFLEEEILVYVISHNIDYLTQKCFFAKKATSIDYKNILRLVEERSSGTLWRFYSGFVKDIKPIFESLSEEKLKGCKRCGYPTVTGNLCSLCMLLDRVKDNISRD